MGLRCYESPLVKSQCWRKREVVGVGCTGPASMRLGDKSPPRTARHSISVCIALYLYYLLERSLWLHELFIHAVLQCYNYICTDLSKCPFAGPDRRTRMRYT